MEWTGKLYALQLAGRGTGSDSAKLALGPCFAANDLRRSSWQQCSREKWLACTMRIESEVGDQIQMRHVSFGEE